MGFNSGFKGLTSSKHYQHSHLVNGMYVVSVQEHSFPGCGNIFIIRLSYSDTFPSLVFSFFLSFLLIASVSVFHSPVNLWQTHILFFVLLSLCLSQRFCFSFSCHFSHRHPFCFSFPRHFVPHKEFFFHFPITSLTGTLFVFRFPVTSSLTKILFFNFLSLPSQTPFFVFRSLATSSLTKEFFFHFPVTSLTDNVFVFHSPVTLFLTKFFFTSLSFLSQTPFCSSFSRHFFSQTVFVFIFLSLLSQTLFLFFVLPSRHE